MNVVQALRDPELFERAFGDLASWRAWSAVLGAAFALPPSGEDEVALFRELTGRTAWPSAPCRELVLVIGRRGGKSRVLALLAVYLACFRDHAAYLVRGERAVCMLLATDRDQAQVIFSYVRALIMDVPMLAAMVEREAADSIELNNGAEIAVHTCSFRAVRGRTVLAFLGDETAFWRDETSANPDQEVLRAVRPGMATVPGSLLVIASTPYRKHGALYQAWRDHFGRDGDGVLVVQGASKAFNPSLADAVIARAYEDDLVAAEAEYGASFRGDLASFLPEDLIEAALRPDARELPPMEGITYRGFCDPSGGRHDAMTLAVGHREADGRIVVDAVRRRMPPFAPQAVVGEFAAVLKGYGVNAIAGDAYSGAWCSTAFASESISYRRSEKPKSDLYLAALPMFAQGKVSIPRDKTLIVELRALERRTHRSGRDTIDHGPHGRDDAANAVAGVLWELRAKRKAHVHAWSVDSSAPPGRLSSDYFSRFIDPRREML